MPRRKHGVGVDGRSGHCPRVALLARSPARRTVAPVRNGSFPPSLSHSSSGPCPAAIPLCLIGIRQQISSHVVPSLHPGPSPTSCKGGESADASDKVTVRREMLRSVHRRHPESVGRNQLATAGGGDSATPNDNQPKGVQATPHGADALQACTPHPPRPSPTSHRLVPIISRRTQTSIADTPQTRDVNTLTRKSDGRPAGRTSSSLTLEHPWRETPQPRSPPWECNHRQSKMWVRKVIRCAVSRGLAS